MLNFYAKVGAKVTKIHRVLNLNRVIYVRIIMTSIQKRIAAKTEAEKGVSPLIANSLYGRVCMRPLKFFESTFVNDEAKIMKSIIKSNFRNITKYKHYKQLGYTKKKKNMMHQYM